MPWAPVPRSTWHLRAVMRDHALGGLVSLRWSPRRLIVAATGRGLPTLRPPSLRRRPLSRAARLRTRPRVLLVLSPCWSGPRCPCPRLAAVVVVQLCAPSSGCRPAGSEPRRRGTFCTTTRRMGRSSGGPWCDVGFRLRGPGELGWRPRVAMSTFAPQADPGDVRRLCGRVWAREPLCARRYGEMACGRRVRYASCTAADVVDVHTKLAFRDTQTPVSDGARICRHRAMRRFSPNRSRTSGCGGSSRTLWRP